MVKQLPVIVVVGLILVGTSGFRTMGFGHQWDLSKTNPWVWIDFDPSELDKGFEETKFADDSTPFAGIATELLVPTALKMIADDYNAVKTSYFRLAPKPIDGFSQTIEGAPTYQDSLGENRTIKVKIQGQTGLSGGYAKQSIQGEHVDGCTIVLPASVFKSAEGFKRTLTHEIGHCAGLNHDHVDVQSIMSYSTKRNDLGIDDKMGLTYLYPMEESYGKEIPTLGLSCSRR